MLLHGQAPHLRAGHQLPHRGEQEGAPEDDSSPLTTTSRHAEALSLADR